MRGVFKAELYRYGWVVPVHCAWADDEGKPRTLEYTVFIGEDFPSGGIREGGIGPEHGNFIERVSN